MHLVSTSAAAALVRRAAPTAQVRVAALPVSSRFGPPPVEAVRERPLVYVSCGSMAFGDLAEACSAVLDAGADVLVTCGRNSRVRRRLLQLARRHPRGAAMRVVDWVDDPAAATAACDIVVTNAAGATTLEALACARPLLLFAPIPGHGRATAALLADAGLARVCPEPEDLHTAVAELRDTGRRDAVVRRLLARLTGTDLTADVAALAQLGSHSRAPLAPRVRAQDALFLHAATPEVPQQVGARILVEDPAARDDWPDHLAELVRTRVPDIPLLRRRLQRPRLARPLRWLVDPDPDPARHVHPGIVEIGADGASPTWDDALTTFFATVVDPVSTGWELQVARDRAAGEVAVLAKVHHALGDGLAVTDALIRLLTDEAPQATVGPRAQDRDFPAGAADRLRRAATVVRGRVGGTGPRASACSRHRRTAPRDLPRRAVRVGHRKTAALGAADRRGARIRPDGGVRQRRSALRLGDRPHPVRADAVARAARRAGGGGDARDSWRRAGRRAGGPQRPRCGDAAVREFARLRTCVAQPRQHRSLLNGSAERACDQVAHSKTGCA